MDILSSESSLPCGVNGWLRTFDRLYMCIVLLSADGYLDVEPRTPKTQKFHRHESDADVALVALCDVSNYSVSRENSCRLG